ncbi:MAG TPA: hypothetical protein VG248_00760 [Caulobacteraceae bacterium]|jgi:hypothetical protein|nr:hypothetical protein [Caulobacteraceae bacterium]
MNDAVFYSLVVLAAAAMVALALVWPQGLGAPSPAPFGHRLTPERPAAAAAPVRPFGP